MQTKFAIKDGKNNDDNDDDDDDSGGGGGDSVKYKINLFKKDDL